MEATTTTAAEAPTTTKSTAMEASSAKAASVTAATSATTSECLSWLNQADRCQCEQSYNRFSHYAFPPLEEVAPKAYNTFAAGLFGDQTAISVN